MKKDSIKNIRINQEVQKELSSLIMRELKDPRIHMMTSVTHVEVAPDLKTAKVYISILGSDEELKDTIKGLKSAAPFLRTQLAKSINLRNTPELIFIEDQSIAYGIEMSRRLDRLAGVGTQSETEDTSGEDSEQS